MNTDKNGWPYLLSTFGVFACVGFVIATTSNTTTMWIGCISSLLFWTWLSLFLNLSFSELLKPVSLHKKFVFSVCPFIYLYLPWRYWVLKQLAPERNYQQFLEDVGVKRGGNT